MTAAVFSPQARRDLLEAVQWIARDNPAAARALREVGAKAARRLAGYPGIGMVKTELADPPVRFLTLTAFPHVIVYDSDRRPPLILRVLHGARDLPDILRDL